MPLSRRIRPTTVLLLFTLLLILFCNHFISIGTSDTPSSFRIVNGPADILKKRISRAATNPARYAQPAAPRYKIDGNTITFASDSADDAAMAIFEAHPEIKTIRFIGVWPGYYINGPGLGPFVGSGSGPIAFHITSKGFAQLAKSQNLESVEIIGFTSPKISDNDLQHLAGRPLKVLRHNNVIGSPSPQSNTPG